MIAVAGPWADATSIGIIHVATAPLLPPVRWPVFVYGACIQFLPNHSTLDLGAADVVLPMQILSQL